MLFVPRKVLRVAVCTLFALLAHPARASIVFVDNFGPGESYNPNVSWALSYEYPTLGQPFNAQSSFPLESISLGLTADYGITSLGGPNEVDVFFMSDATARPGAVLEAFHFSNAMPPRSSQVQPPLTATSVLHPVLQYGERYWVVASIAGYVSRPAIYAGWHQNVMDQGGPMVYQQRGDPTWHLVTPLTLGAYRVMGVLVPEPSTLALGFAAMLAGALRVLRKALRAGSTARSVMMCGVAAAA